MFRYLLLSLARRLDPRQLRNGHRPDRPLPVLRVGSVTILLHDPEPTVEPEPLPQWRREIRDDIRRYAADGCWGQP